MQPHPGERVKPEVAAAGVITTPPADRFDPAFPSRSNSSVSARAGAGAEAIPPAPGCARERSTARCAGPIASSKFSGEAAADVPVTTNPLTSVRAQTVAPFLAFPSFDRSSPNRTSATMTSDQISRSDSSHWINGSSPRNRTFADNTAWPLPPSHPSAG
jgi:hypothetical protein